MKKYKKIFTIVLSLAMSLCIFTISTSAYMYTSESGNTYIIPEEYSGIQHNIPEINFASYYYPHSMYPIYTYRHIGAEGTVLEGNSIINDFYTSDELYSYYSDSSFVEIELPNLTQGKYTVNFDLRYQGKTNLCMPEDDLLLLKTPGYGNYVNLLSFSYDDVEDWLNGTTYDFSCVNGVLFELELNFDFDTNILTFIIYDQTGRTIEVERSLDNFDGDMKNLPIRLRYQIQSGRYCNLNWQGTYIENFLLSTAPVSFTPDELTFLDSYIREIEITEGQLKWEESAENSSNIYQSQIDDLNDEIFSLNIDIENLTAELEITEQKYQSAKEGLDNSNAVLNFFQGCYEAVHGVLNDIFGLEVFGFSFGNIAAILLIAFFVIFILKLVF